MKRETTSARSSSLGRRILRSQKSTKAVAGIGGYPQGNWANYREERERMLLLLGRVGEIERGFAKITTKIATAQMLACFVAGRRAHVLSLLFLLLLLPPPLPHQRPPLTFLKGWGKLFPQSGLEAAERERSWRAGLGTTPKVAATER